EVGREFVARGIPRERIRVTGVPLRAEFARAVDGAAARAALGLHASEPVVLAMAGSHGRVGRLPEIVRTLGRLPATVHASVGAGREAALARKLRQLAGGAPIRVVGYVEDVRTLMAAADLLVTKAGGMTLAEALAAELPMLFYGSLPGQERCNERFASQTGIALAARSPRGLAPPLDRALAGPGVPAHSRARLPRVRRPDATERIVDLVPAGRHQHA